MQIHSDSADCIASITFLQRNARSSTCSGCHPWENAVSSQNIRLSNCSSSKDLSQVVVWGESWGFAVPNTAENIQCLPIPLTFKMINHSTTLKISQNLTKSTVCIGYPNFFQSAVQKHTHWWNFMVFYGQMQVCHTHTQAHTHKQVPMLQGRQEERMLGPWTDFLLGSELIFGMCMSSCTYIVYVHNIKQNLLNNISVIYLCTAPWL